MPQPSPTDDPRTSRGAGRGAGPGDLTSGASGRFPTRRELGRLAGRILGGTALGVAGAAGTAAAAPRTAAPDATVPGHRTTVVRVPDPTAAAGTRPARVSYLDPADLRDAAVPVVYLLHGLPGTAGDFENSGVTAALFTAATALGLRLVVVCPAGACLHPDDPRTDTEWGDDVRGQWQLETWMHTRLRTAVEGTAVRATRDRVIGGFSMGGFGAAMIGMRHPAVYGSIAAIAGYFHLDDPDGVFGTDPENRVLHRPDHLVFPHRTQRYLLADGAQDSLPLTAPETPRFTESLLAHGYVPEVYRPPGDHDFAVVLAVIPALARWIAGR